MDNYFLDLEYLSHPKINDYIIMSRLIELEVGKQYSPSGPLICCNKMASISIYSVSGSSLIVMMKAAQFLILVILISL